MSDIIKEKFKKRAVIYDNIWMYFIDTAKELVLYCKNKNINITSFEAFKLTGQGIQPSQENSVSFDIGKNNWDKATEFLSNIKDTDYLYEIWYEGY